MDPAAVEQIVRDRCLALPEATERVSHGAPAFFVGKQFVHLWVRGHHQETFAQLWCAAPPGAQEELIAAFPERIFRPRYVGHRGWIGVRLDGEVDWDGVDELIRAAYRHVAPRRLAEALP